MWGWVGTSISTNQLVGMRTRLWTSLGLSVLVCPLG